MVLLISNNRGHLDGIAFAENCWLVAWPEQVDMHDYALRLYEVRCAAVNSMVNKPRGDKTVQFTSMTE